MEEIIWKNIPGYEGIYEVSSTGSVRTSKGKTTRTSFHGVRKWKQRELKQKTDRDGYKRVSLWKDGKVKDFLVHRLVALTFIDKPEEKNIINHKDCSPSNNRIENLEWCDHSENLLHAYKNRLNKSNDRVILLHVKTNESVVFTSKAEASLFLGKSKGYISNVIIQGKKRVGDYEIFVNK